MSHKAKNARHFLPALIVLTSATVQASAADVQITIAGIRNNHGHVLVAICEQADFLKPRCPWHASTQAIQGEVHLTINAVPPGTYAAQAFQDEDDNGTLERSFLGLPKEGMGFSNDARMHFGPPSFQSAAFKVTQAGAQLSFTLRYY